MPKGQMKGVLLMKLLVNLVLGFVWVLISDQHPMNKHMYCAYIFLMAERAIRYNGKHFLRIYLRKKNKNIVYP